MPYITREDGQHFVIPSYRDVLTVKQKSQLKKEILLLSKSYGEYITLQKKGPQTYEVAFSSDTGYLLGESIWSYFKKPLDLIYCEAIPNTTEAILVIVKAGSVYLDGSFPLDSISEELIIFLTQQNNFEIYTYGDVPISKDAAAGKFSFEPGSVKSFTVLDKPVFPSLPLASSYQLKLVDTILKEQGIGALPVRQIVIAIAFAVLGYFAYSYFTAAPPPPPPPSEAVVNPYQVYFDRLTSPAPDEELAQLTNTVNTFLQITGWSFSVISYSSNSVTATLLSNGGSIADLYAFADAHKASVNILQSGVFLSMSLGIATRPVPNQIYPTQKVLAALIDRLAKIIPGNNILLSSIKSSGVFSTAEVTINLTDISPTILDLIGKQFSGLPIVLNTVNVSMDENGSLNGSIILNVLGS